jgi:hypothetical protein
LALVVRVLLHQTHEDQTGKTLCLVLLPQQAVVVVDRMTKVELEQMAALVAGGQFILKLVEQVFQVKVLLEVQAHLLLLIQVVGVEVLALLA